MCRPVAGHAVLEPFGRGEPLPGARSSPRASAQRQHGSRSLKHAPQHRTAFGQTLKRELGAPVGLNLPKVADRYIDGSVQINCKISVRLTSIA